MDIRPDRHDLSLQQGSHPLIDNLFGVTLIVIGVALPLLVLYALWGWVGVRYGGLVAASLILGAICSRIGLKLL